MAINNLPAVVPQPNLATLAAAHTSWRTFLAVHPAADRIPDATEDEKRTLATDLARQGQRQPIVLVQVLTRPNDPPQLLDGRSRLDLLSAAGVEVVDANGKVKIHHRTIQVADDAEAEQLSLSLNVHRRHLTAEQRQNALIKHIARTPEKSDRQIAKEAGVDHKTIAKARAKGVDVGNVPHVLTRIDARGRKQPAGKKSVKRASAESGQPRKPPEKGDSLVEIKRRIKLADELPKIKNTSLDTPTEKDALIELKQLDASCAAKLVSRAAQGEAVSAAAEIDKRKFKPRPNAAELMEVFNRHLLRVWVRASPAERRQWLKNLEENVDLDTPASPRGEAAA